MYDRILVPVDGSAPAERAVDYGALLAEAYGAELELLHVLAGGGDIDTATGDAGDERGEAVLAAAAERVGDRAAVETRLIEGIPHRVIAERVPASDADLVVMGRRGRAGLGEGLLGSVTERVVVGVDAPVLVVPREVPVPDGLSSVLLPTDGSENAEAAAGHAVDLARRFGARLHVATVVDVDAAGGLFGSGEVTDDIVERLEAGGSDAVDRMVAVVREYEPDVDPVTAVVRGTPHEGIHDYVAEHDVDLVAMGSRGQSGIERQLFGSVTKRVLRMVDVPVLVVRGG